MFRPPPPRGRVHRLLLAGLLLCSVAVPALPAGASDALTEVPATAAPLAVTGRSPLVVPVPVQADPITVVMTPERGKPSQWVLEPTDATEYTVDLDLPDEGAPVANGTLTLAVTLAGATLLDTIAVVDRDPPAPSFAAVEDDRDVYLLWNRGRAVGAVTYRLERSAAGGRWTTLAAALDDIGYSDPGVRPGRYRYRLTAAVAGADGTPNLSVPALINVRVAGQATPAPPQDPRPEQPTAPTPAAPEPARKRAAPARKVAATGGIRGPVTPSRPRPARRGSTRTPTLQPLEWSPRTRQQLAAGPSIAPPRFPAEVQPQVAPPRADLVPAVPVIAPPSGMLAIEAAHSGRVPHVGSQTIALGLTLAAMGAYLRRRRPGELSLVPGDRP